MLVKLAYAMQFFLKNVQKIFVMINKDGGTIFRFCGGHNCYEGGHIAHGGPGVPQSPPPPGKTLPVVCSNVILEMKHFDTHLYLHPQFFSLQTKSFKEPQNADFDFSWLQKQISISNHTTHTFGWLIE